MNLLERHRLALAWALIALIALIVVLVRANPWSASDGHPERWSSPVVSANGTRVTVTFTVDGCFRDADAETAEGRDAVTITVLVHDPAGTSCDVAEQARTATVVLDEPLGDRALVDGAASDDDDD